MSVRYFKHKVNNVTCELVPYFNQIRFSKWKWKNGFCQEEYTLKDLTPDFFNSFDEITEQEFNIDWGNKLQNA